jgi:hypothetical protein
VTVESPCALLALFAAVFGASASTTLGKLASVLFPFAALVVCTLADTSTCVILTAEISHNNAGPVLHISAVVADCELLDQWEEVEVVGEQVLLIVGIFIVDLGLLLFFIHGRHVLINGSELLANLEARNEMALLEIGAKTAVLRDIGKKLQRHEHILLSRHRSDHLRIGNKVAVEEISRDGSGGQRGLRRRVQRRTVR